jgi:hypothetical protein
MNILFYSRMAFGLPDAKLVDMAAYVTLAVRTSSALCVIAKDSLVWAYTRASSVGGMTYNNAVEAALKAAVDYPVEYAAMRVLVEKQVTAEQKAETMLAMDKWGDDASKRAQSLANVIASCDPVTDFSYKRAAREIAMFYIFKWIATKKVYTLARTDAERHVTMTALKRAIEESLCADCAYDLICMREIETLCVRKYPNSNVPLIYT